ncbi:MAG: KAP family P-loop NTPase fold protein [Sulfurovaceae bacterium]
MTDNQNELPQLRCTRTDIDGTPPFNEDLLNRKDLAIKLTGYIDRLNEGAVLAIDAPWGEGKTWFGKNWKQYLESEDRKVIYIDAFEQDYIDDPFMLLASEFVELLSGGEEQLKNYKDKATKVAKATMSIGAKIGMGLLTKYALGGIDLGKEIEESMSKASEEVSSLSSKWIEAKFDEHEQDKKTITAFRDELKSLASGQEKPIVIFIDELDRCKPDFAVRLIERIKHFFDVPNIVFVLLINREQLENAIKGVYGSDTDASAYLGKFINFFFLLPKHKFEDYNSVRYFEKYVKVKFQNYKFPTNVSNDTIEFLSELAVAFDLSLRDIETVIGLYAFAYPVQNFSDILIYIIVLKQKNYKLFQQLLKGDRKAHESMKNKMDELISIADSKRSDTFMFEAFKGWHEAYLNDFNYENMSKQIVTILGSWQNTTRLHSCTLKDMLPYFAKIIDLKMER